MSPAEPRNRLDITREVCPMTWVKTRLELEDMAAGDVLQVSVREGESHHNLRENSAREGHEILEDKAAKGREGIREVTIRRGAG